MTNHLAAGLQRIKMLKASSKHTDTFPNLLRCLQEKLTDSRHRELYLVRGIMAWIAHNQTANGRWRYNTPLGIVKEMIERRVTAVEVFATFFGYANIEHEIIRGRAKAVKYRAGDPDSDYLKNHSWIMFKADGTWHLMQPDWCIQKRIGFEHGDETDIEDSHGGNVALKGQSAGTFIYEVNDFWFCTRPNVFVKRCFPDDSQMQNPNKRGEVLLKMVKEFLNVPDYRQGYFTYGLTLISEKSCNIKSKNGMCCISLLADKKFSGRLDFAYELTLLSSNANNLITKQLRRLVMSQVKNTDTFVFEIRLPAVGVYFFKLSVGLFDSKSSKQNCLQFRITCDKAVENCKLCPEDGGLGVFGFGPEAEDAGLRSPYVLGAKVVVKPDKKLKQNVMSFHTDDDPNNEREYEAVMFGNDFADEGAVEVSFDGQVETVYNKDKRKVDVKANIPKDGEYSVVVKTKRKGEKQSSKPAACYVVTTKNDKENEKNEQQLNESIKKTKLYKNLEKKKEKIVRARTSLENLHSDIDSLMKELNV
ncbi:HIL-like protein [Mya arenaria]|uniref:HIL-like protein n=1 Tax=Mya arenaria TaxID=6604 RepID=A0ABY7FM35_MYAAR|nr:HIL-like protein [Mya arenaria]